MQKIKLFKKVMKTVIATSLLLALIILPGYQDLGAQTISPNFFGLNAWMPDYTGSRHLNGPLHNKWNFVKNTHANVVRVGGIAFDRDKMTNHQYLKMVDSIRTAGMEPMIQVPYWKGKYSATQAADLVKYLNGTMKRNIKYWSIGNEPDHSGSYEYTNASQVAPYIKSFASAMKAADPSIKIIAPDCAWYNRRILEPLTSPGNTYDITGKDNHGRFYVDYISFHQYPFRGEQTRSQVISELRAPGKYKDRLVELNNRLSNCNNYHGRSGDARLKTALTEANIGYRNPSGDDIWGLGTNSFIGGQFWTEMMAISIGQSVEFINFWGFTNTLGMIDKQDVRRPSYFHFQMMASNFRGRYCSGSGNRDNVKVFGSKSSTQIAVMILNQSTNSDHNYTLRLNTEGVQGSGSLKMNLNASVNREYSSNIQNQSTTLLIFDLEGNLMRKCEYKLVGHADRNRPPSCRSYLPSAQITVSGNLDICLGETVLLSTDDIAGYSYQWLKNGNEIKGAVAASYKANSSGEYTVEVSNAGGTNLSAAIQVKTIHLAAKILPPAKTEICVGENILLHANTGGQFHYQWKKNNININGATDSTYHVTANGSYQVAITSEGCTNTSDPVIISPSDCEITSITENADAPEFSLYPNPTSGLLTLRLSKIQDKEPVQVEIFTREGKLIDTFRVNVINGKVKKQFELNAYYAEGTYIIRVTTAAHQFSKKILLKR